VLNWRGVESGAFLEVDGEALMEGVGEGDGGGVGVLREEGWEEEELDCEEEEDEDYEEGDAMEEGFLLGDMNMGGEEG
jgi:hypothetical protein